MNKAHYHHTHINTVDCDATIAYYSKYFGAVPLTYKNKSKALFTERSFLLLDQVAQQPQTNIGSSLWHIGWSGVDGPSEFEWRVNEGISVHAPVTPLNDDHWMYFNGPSNELVEVFTGNKNHRFEHLHLLATDVNETMNWFETYLGLKAVNKTAQPWSNKLFKWNHLFVDNINIYVYGKPVEERTWFPKTFKPTDGSAFDHIAFSFENIELEYNRMVTLGVEIVKEIEIDPLHDLKRFLVRGPDLLLVEIVEEKPIPSGIW
jgi:catechol 2,3-dioxygenase-like lactoylglutathione lyase family enzyme